MIHLTLSHCARVQSDFLLGNPVDHQSSTRNGCGSSSQDFNPSQSQPNEVDRKDALCQTTVIGLIFVIFTTYAAALAFRLHNPRSCTPTKQTRSMSPMTSRMTHLYDDCCMTLVRLIISYDLLKLLHKFKTFQRPESKGQNAKGRVTSSKSNYCIYIYSFSLTIPSFWPASHAAFTDATHPSHGFRTHWPLRPYSSRSHHGSNIFPFWTVPHLVLFLLSAPLLPKQAIELIFLSVKLLKSI